MNFEAREIGFAPKDLARITGLSPTMQRDWRRAGYLPRRESGWASFSLRDVAAIALRKAFADVDFGPSFANPIFSSPLADRVIDSVVWWAVERGEAWTIADGDPHAAELQRAVEVALNRDRFAVIDLITGIRFADIGRLLTVFPASGEMYLEAEGLRLEEERPGVIGISVSLVDIGAQLSLAAGGPLLALTSRPEG